MTTDPKEAAIERLARAIEKRIPYQIDWDEIGWAEAVARIAIEQAVVPAIREQRQAVYDRSFRTMQPAATDHRVFNIFNHQEWMDESIPYDAVCAGESK